MHSRSPGPRGLVFGGIMAGLVVVCALVPFLTIFIPIPLVLTYLRFGGRTAVLTAVVSTLLTAMFKGPVMAFLLTVPAGILPGMVFGYGLSRKMRPLSIGLLAVAIFFVGYAAEYTVMRVALYDGRDPFVVVLESEQGRAMLERTLAMSEKFSTAQQPRTEAEVQIVEQQKAMIAEFRRDPVAYTWAMLPMVVLLTGAGATLVNYLLCRWILPRFGHQLPVPTPFGRYSMPAWLVWIFAVASMGSSYLSRSLLDAPWWVKVVFNVLPPLLLVFVVAGMAVLYGFLRIKKGLTKPSAIAITLLPLLLPGGLGMNLYVIGAMWDTIFDFRGLGHGLWKPPQETP